MRRAAKTKIAVPVRVVRAERNISISGAGLPGRDAFLVYQYALTRPDDAHATENCAFFDLHRGIADTDANGE